MFSVNSKLNLEMFYLNSTLNFGIPPVLVFQLEVYCKVDRLLTGIPAQQKGTTARWYSNKTSLIPIFMPTIESLSKYGTSLPSSPLHILHIKKGITFESMGIYAILLLIYSFNICF